MKYAAANIALNQGGGGIFKDELIKTKYSYFINILNKDKLSEENDLPTEKVWTYLFTDLIIGV